VDLAIERLVLLSEVEYFAFMTSTTEAEKGSFRLIGVDILLPLRSRSNLLSGELVFPEKFDFSCNL